MPTLTDTELDTEMASAVEGAFKELDCCSQRKEEVPCGGEIAGYQEFHDCIQGWLCANHWKYATETLYPQWRTMLDETGQVRCVHCLNVFHNIHQYVRLTAA